jgi:homogentisate 1,2-dioxygenase
MRYVTLGEVPAKRHAQVWRGTNRGPLLLVEEVLGYEGFSGNESILYHLHSPCRLDHVGGFRPLVREEWVPDAHVHRLANTAPVEPGGDPVEGRRLLMWNADIEVSVCKPTTPMDGFYRNGEGDEVVYVHRGSGVVRTMFGPVAYRPKDYVVIPRGTTHRWEPEAGVEQQWICFHTPGEIETPNRYRNRYGQLLEHAPYSQRDFHPPGELDTVDETGEWTVTLRVRDGLQTYLLDRHPFDVVGWDGYVYPYTFNADDFEPRAGRFHLPPPAHQTFQGPSFVICTFAPRMLDWDETAVPLPYHHSNIQSEEVMFYAEGDYAARKGVDVGCLTLHPSGLPHGPQPGTVEKALGATRTNELAVMWDTFRPLRLSTLWRDIDDPSYAYSWNPDRAEAGAKPSAGNGAAAPKEATVTGPSA